MGAGFVITVLFVGALLGLVAKHTINQELEDSDESHSEHG